MTMTNGGLSIGTTEKLIQEVKKRPPLWDQKNLNYHNRVVVNALWEEIADTLGISKEIGKMKWKGLRDTYRRELKKCQRALNMVEVVAPKDPTWIHYGSMTFLQNHMGQSSFLPLGSNDWENSFVPYWVQQAATANPLSIELLAIQPLQTRLQQARKLKYDKMRRRRWQPRNEDQDDMLFFKSLIPFVRHLSPERKLNLRTEIHALVLKEITSSCSGSGIGGMIDPMDHVDVKLGD